MNIINSIGQVLSQLALFKEQKKPPVLNSAGGSLFILRM